ncbi:hypothetical protein FB451DRAFT_486494 [Mycena latifolia]|nr:hypothetical protein FB451DRAFT_486494 [Mycena latifolia]
MFFVPFQILALAALATQFATAAPAPAPEFVTLLGFGSGDDAPTTFSASIIGVDNSKARTTYALAQNEMQGSSTLALGTATLVEASDYVSYTYGLDGEGIEVTIGFDFTIEGGNAIATGLDESSRPFTTSVPTASLGALVVDLPPTGAPGGPLPTGKSNSSHRTAASVFGALLMGLTVVCQLV